MAKQSNKIATKAKTRVRIAFEVECDVEEDEPGSGDFSYDAEIAAAHAAKAVVDSCKPERAAKLACLSTEYVVRKTYNVGGA